MESFDQFSKSIKEIIPASRLFTDPLRLLAWGTDAGFYRYLPKMVVTVETPDEVSRVMELATRCEVPVTFRAAGTSLSGQAVSDSVLIVAGKAWEGYSIAPDASTITLQPGIIGDRVNQILAPLGRMFSPDPASKKSAMVGGIVANNASGMNCGVKYNSDRELISARIILTDGTVLDTADAVSRAAFTASHPELLKEIEAIRDEIRADKDLSARIAHKYEIKNVMGLNLLPFITYDDPFEIIAHLMVGSEGTLAFISEVTMKTEHLYPYAASALLYFTSMEEASQCVVALEKSAPVFSCEMLDSKSLEAVHDTTGTGLTALLLDTKADTEAELQANIDAIMKVVDTFKLYVPAHFSTDPAETAAWWSLRSGIFPTVGGTRPKGTTVLIEDIAFHINDLPKATTELAALLQECGYHDACIYGHALAGNYHFIISQNFDSEEEVAQYKNLMLKIVELVVDRYDGSLKAEHGVGRNMAPFVRKEWGDKAYSMMKRVKNAFDPLNLLNRGSMFNDDPECYLHNMKPLTPVHDIVDKCIECGFCEVNCVSCGFTLSARQRIVTLREIARLEAIGTPEARKAAGELRKSFGFLGNATCAGDGLCSTSCPMKINTGEMIHLVREAGIPEGSLGYKTGIFAANHLSGITSGMRLMLDAANITRKIIGDKAVNAIGEGMNKIGMPLWNDALPDGFSPKKALKEAAEMPRSYRKVVYFPSCINRTMGVTEEKGKKIAPLVETILNLCRKAGYEVVFPKDMNQLCCGMIWESKGMPEKGDRMLDTLHEKLWEASEGGKYPVMCDQSPCLHRMRNGIKDMHLYEPAEFIEKYLVPHLDFKPTDEPVAVHVTCSTRRMGLAPVIIGLANRCSTNVTVPAEVGCCGFAGDKGFFIPELNRWALRKLRPALEQAGVKSGYSNSRTCEIGLTANSGVSYKSIAYLVDEVTTPKK